MFLGADFAKRAAFGPMGRLWNSFSAGCTGERGGRRERRGGEKLGRREKGEEREGGGERRGRREKGEEREEARARTHARTYARTHSRSRAHTHIHTQSAARSGTERGVLLRFERQRRRRKRIYIKIADIKCCQRPHRLGT